MPYTRSSEIWQALVAKLRATPAVENALSGGIHRGAAPEKVRYPFIVYRPVATPYEGDFTGRMLIAVVDILAVSKNSVDADNVDQSVMEALDNAALTVNGQSHMVTRRVADLDLDPETDENGDKVFPIGGTYEIWTHQVAS